MNQAGWYDDGSGTIRWWDGEAWGDQVQPPPTAPQGPGGPVDQMAADAISGKQSRPAPRGATYVVLQVRLKEAVLGTGSGNLTELEHAINAQAALGYRLHTITTTLSSATGFFGGELIQATMVFEKIL